MLILGLLLLVCTAAFTGFALADNLNGGPDYDVTVFGHHIATMDSLAIFCAGLALALIFGLGVIMAMAGLSLRRRKARKLHAARRDARDAARERDELAARLENADTLAATGPDRPATGDTDRPARQQDLAANRDLDEAGAVHTGKTPRRHARHLFGH
ncbi:hypothetical protein [Actinacidiphila sp. ITFR-21]|uniref:hypothetical protein n=1 Tax=Actinacidiphila sp. ITFR-21 TaxID=3075199 RepID=UPI00288A5AD7|nr:hypothetical protein [Streptomyces sp. ITFR-21]WNI17973.1 hypothetical protein RLT57_22115 [Streptomyces sp. ITFR-21]